MFLDCASLAKAATNGRNTWLSNTTLGAPSMSCSSTNFNYGIYQNAVDNSIASAGFSTRYLYSLWLGLLALRYGFLNSEVSPIKI